MLPLTICALFLFVPVFAHFRTFDVAAGSAASALIIGGTCGLLGLFRQDWSIGLLSFFLAAFFGFGVAYLVGLTYRALGSYERRTFSAAQAAAPLSRIRQAIGAVGALAIPLAVVGTAALNWWQSGLLPSMSTEAALGFLVLFVLAIAALIGLYASKRRE